MIAIDQAKGGRDGLNGKEAGDLLGQVSAVRRALQAEDFPAARAAADDLRARADKATKGMSQDRARAITDAIAAMIRAIPA